jgi:sulfoxide reductase heme-binding subunit YedZ
LADTQERSAPPVGRARPLAALALWRDKRGRFSWVRAATLAVLLVPPVLALAAAFGEDGLGARPLNNLVHRAGFWALMFILLSLAVTPLRRVARYGGLIDVRRMIGVGAFCYVVAHLTLYAAQEHFDLGKVASEIALRIYLTIGFTAFCGLLVLAVTSTDRMVRRLGGMRWRRLHQATYAIAVLGLIHFFQQTKADTAVPTLAAGLFAWLMAYRVVVARRRGSGDLPTWALLALTLVVAALTFVGEAVGIGLYYGVSPLLVLQTAFDFDLAVRPGWYVLAAGLAVVALDLIRARRGAPRPGRGAGAGRLAEQASGG